MVIGTFLKGVHMIIVFTGAGISKASGIDTFLEQPDLRDKLHRSYATQYPKSYNEAIGTLIEISEKAQPNDAHICLAEYNIPVLTMNIDGLHERAGSNVIALHGTLPSVKDVNRAHLLYNQPVLYGDAAPNYQRAFDKVMNLGENDLFIVVGASSYTQVADQLRHTAKLSGAQVIEIQSNAETELRKVIEANLQFIKGDLI